MEAWWSLHGVVLPVLLPLATAVTLLWLGDQGGLSAQGGGHASARVRLQRALSLGSVTLGLLLALGLVGRAADGALVVYELGDWPAPFGIVLVLDRLAALMVLLTQAVALPVLAYACGGWDVRGRHFHALFHFQLMGLNGAFLTGDLFNLFVFFEVLLIASYTLLLHGQGRERLRMGVHYVVLNLTASALFLIALALIYASTGTLNMADVAQKVARLQGTELRLAQAAALLLLVVFGLKAALVPLYAWLPATYAAASAPVAALFAVMTKVGLYAIVRVHWVIFGLDAGAASSTAQPWLLGAAVLTSLLGVMGALAAHTLGRMVAYLTVASVGTIALGVGLFTPATLSAALYYTLHSTVVIAGLFLLVEQVAAQRGAMADRLQPASAVREPVLLGVTMLFGAASAAGLPPLPGFIGKVMLLQSSAGLPSQPWVWALVLGVGFLTLLGLARAGIVMFWHVEPARPEPSAGSSVRLLAAPWVFMALTLGLALAAAPIKAYTDAAAQQLTDKAAYAEAVLARQGGPWVPTARPYDGRWVPQQHKEQQP
ncbi:MAG: monovalent cation/H+ antiporter subunit D [Tepidimonas sp.]|uniref:monovalent cation/H+ antiporter subunit D n=1 Tax=Tepidimonas sp. TaxID=2002775 RepID=UPI00298F3921|nr:monovalent cation/H+ antiporter subunit D [Tepidimonas sp.]MDW8336773.1 monovalent cation/H+ antiporter subunit D [Tepidimonas sp.]